MSYLANDFIFKNIKLENTVPKKKKKLQINELINSTLQISTTKKFLFWGGIRGGGEFQIPKYRFEILAGEPFSLAWFPHD